MSYANGWSWHAAQCPKFKRFLINKTQSPTTYMQKTGWTNYSSSLVWSGKEVYLGCDHSGIFNINHFPVYRPFLARWKTGWSWSKPALDHWEGSLFQFHLEKDQLQKEWRVLLASLLACSASGLDFTRYLECACYGESGKNMHCRSKEHVSKFNSKSEKVRSESPFFKHLMRFSWRQRWQQRIL